MKRLTTRNHSKPQSIAAALAAIYIADRLLKLAAVVHFFRQPRPSPPTAWPSVTLLQPITRSQHDLRRTLATRCALVYAAPIQHLLICDRADATSQAVCRELMANHPAWPATLILVEPDSGVIASKIAKLTAALPQATGDVLCFVDDDVALRPDALTTLVPYILEPAAGAVFGLACYTDWSTLWSSMMSAFVNANALLSYIPLAYLTEPYTITGHCFALRRSVFEAIGGLRSMEHRIDDDHELARRVRREGLRCVQTPLIYDVKNRLYSAGEYHAQLTRWFVFPRQAMLPNLTQRELAASLVGSATSLIPPLLGLLALGTRRATAWRSLALTLGVFAAVYTLCERAFLNRSTPTRRWPLVLATALATPLHILVTFVAGEQITWRGQRLRVRKGGAFEVVSADGTE